MCWQLCQLDVSLPQLYFKYIVKKIKSTVFEHPPNHLAVSSVCYPCVMPKYLPRGLSVCTSLKIVWSCYGNQISDRKSHIPSIQPSVCERVWETQTLNLSSPTPHPIQLRAAKDESAALPAVKELLPVFITFEHGYQTESSAWMTLCSHVPQPSHPSNHTSNVWGSTKAQDSQLLDQEALLQSRPPRLILILLAIIIFKT